MDKQKFSSPLSLRDVQIKDAFWKKEMELVRTEVIPYQWAAAERSGRRCCAKLLHAQF